MTFFFFEGLLLIGSAGAVHYHHSTVITIPKKNQLQMNVLPIVTFKFVKSLPVWDTHEDS